MSMFDYLQIHDPAIREQVKCAHGHVFPADHEWQTKDLDCLMDTVYLHDGKVHVAHGGFDSPAEPAPGHPDQFTGAINFYTSCEECPATYWVSKDPSRRRFGPQESRPWTEYVALVRNGQILAVDAVKLETVEEDTKQMEDSGHWLQSDSKSNLLQTPDHPLDK